MTTIDIMRHGESAPGICLGRSYDPPLTDLGWLQMRSAAGQGRPPWARVVSSPSVRCAAFSGELARKHGLPLTMDGRFCELGFGDWEGRSWSDLYAESGNVLLGFQRKPDANPAPGGENYPEFEARVTAAWSDLLVAALGAHCLLVAHAGVLRVILRLVLGFPLEKLFSIQTPHGVLTRIECATGYPPRLAFHRCGA